MPIIPHLLSLFVSYSEYLTYEVLVLSLVSFPVVLYSLIPLVFKVFYVAWLYQLSDVGCDEG